MAAPDEAAAEPLHPVFLLSPQGLGDAVAEEDEGVSGVELDRDLVVLDVVERPQGQARDREGLGRAAPGPVVQRVREPRVSHPSRAFGEEES